MLQLHSLYRSKNLRTRVPPEVCCKRNYVLKYDILTLILHLNRPFTESKLQHPLQESNLHFSLFKYLLQVSYLNVHSNVFGKLTYF
jgi:hypothetical protein